MNIREKVIKALERHPQANGSVIAQLAGTSPSYVSMVKKQLADQPQIVNIELGIGAKAVYERKKAAARRNMEPRELDMMILDTVYSHKLALAVLDDGIE